MTGIAKKIDFIYCGDNKDIYEMMYNNYKKSLQEMNQKIEWGIDSGSWSDRTLTMEDIPESPKSRRYKVISKIEDEDFYNYNFIDKYYSKDTIESDDSLEDSTNKENNTHENTITRSATTVTVSTDGHDGDQSIISVPSEEEEEEEEKDKMNLKDLKENIIRKNTLERKKITKNSDSLIKADAKDIDFSLINDEDDDEEDYNNNDILFIPKNIEKDLSIDPKEVRNSLKNNKHKKCKSDGAYIVMKNKNNLIKSEKNHQSIENQDQQRKNLHDSAPPLSKNRPENKNKHGEEGLQSINRSHSTKCLPVPPRSVSKVHMKEFMRKQRQSDHLNNNSNKIHDYSYNHYNNNNSTINRSMTLRNIMNNDDAEFNVYLRRKYRENKIKILYRNEYYMKELDDKDYDKYDAELFDEQLFLNVENNETDWSEKMVEKSSTSNTIENQNEELSYNILSRKERNPNIISEGYQQLVDKIQKNMKKRELIEQAKREEEKRKNQLFEMDEPIIFGEEEKEEEGGKGTVRNTIRSNHLGVSNFDKFTSYFSTLSTSSSSSSTSVNSSQISNSTSTSTSTTTNPSSIHSNDVKYYTRSTSYNPPSLHRQHHNYQNNKTQTRDTRDTHCSTSTSSSCSTSTSFNLKENDFRKSHGSTASTSSFTSSSYIYPNTSCSRQYYPYQAPTYNDYCFSIQSQIFNDDMKKKIYSNKNTSTDSGSIGSNFTSYYNYCKTYNLPYTSGEDSAIYN